MKNLYLFFLFLSISCTSPRQIKTVFDKSNTIGEFEAGLKSKRIEADSVQYFHNYPMTVNGKTYYCNKQYALVVSIYKSEAFRTNDSARLHSMDTCLINTMYLLQKGRDVKVYEKLDE